MKAHIGISAAYDLQVNRGNGTKEYYPHSKNLIVNQALDCYGGVVLPGYNNSMTGGIVVGTDDTPPSPTDTHLLGALAFTNAITTNWTITDYSAAAPYSVTYSISFTFAKGSVVGTLAEIGMQFSNPAGQKLTDPVASRALIQVDGAPGTITLTDDDELIVTWNITYTIEADGAGSINIVTDGAPVAVNYTTRPCRLTYMGSRVPFAAINFFTAGGGETSFFSTGTALVDATALPPNGTQMGSHSLSAYNQGDYHRVFTMLYGPLAAHTYRMFCLQLTNISFQILLDGDVSFTADQSFAFPLDLSWANAS